MAKSAPPSTNSLKIFYSRGFFLFYKPLLPYSERAKKSPYPMKSRERNGYSFISLFYWSDFNVCSNWADCTTSISIIYPCVATTTSIDLFWNFFAVYSFLFRFKAI